MAETPLLGTYVNMHRNNFGRKKHGERYDQTTKDVVTYEVLSSGQSFSEFKKSNMSYPSKSTIQRHIEKETKSIREGVVDVIGLKKYLESNKYPPRVMLIEDGTKVQQHVQYDSRWNCITGLVNPLDKTTGLPDIDYFKATCPIKIKEHIESCSYADTAYVQLALPLAKGAAPYVLFYVGTNNKFTHLNVVHRWRKTKIILSCEGITVIGFASDGDPKLLKAMLYEIKFLSMMDVSKFGPWFIVDSVCENCFVQDEQHIANKMKNKLLNSDSLKIGTSPITKAHLQALIDSDIGKDKHGLTQSDLNPKDRMKLGPTERMMKQEVRDYLQEEVPNSQGTVCLLKMMSEMHSAFCDVKMQPLQRVFDMWHALFTLRCWRNSCIRRRTTSKECITSNVYACVEINAHAIVLLIEMCREDPEQFLILCFSSQPAEELFRELRSMSTTLQTAVEFSMLEIGDRIRRAFMKVLVSYRQKENLIFPNIIKKMGKYPDSQLLPTTEEIRDEIERARVAASRTLNELGLPSEEQVFTDSLNVRDKPEVQFVSTGHLDEDEEFTENLNLRDNLEAEFCQSDEEMEFEERLNVCSTPEIEFVSTGQLDEDMDFEEDLSVPGIPELEFISTDQIDKIDCYESGDVNVGDSYGDTHYEGTKAKEAESDEETLEENATSNDQDDDLEEIYNAADIFTNFSGELKLKSSTASKQNTFLIKDEKGKVHRIKKSTILWMLTDGRSRQVNSRLERYKQKHLKR